MDSEEAANHQLHVFFFPLMAYGHMIPLIDIAKLFAARSVKTTVILTPGNASVFSKSIDRERSFGLDIHIQVLRFPSIEAGLPEGVENIDDIRSSELLPYHFPAIKMLQEPFEKLLKLHHPDFIVADMFVTFTTEAASKYGIPRFVFHGTGFFPLCVEQSLICHKPHEGLASDTEIFVVPGLPGKIEMTRLQLSDHFIDASGSEFWDEVRESVRRSFGILVNSFYEMEPAYEMHYKNDLGNKAWSIGPVCLRNKDYIDKAQRGKKNSIDEHFILNWLDRKESHSVLYICFGSTYSKFSKAQWLEIALGLEESRASFIWVLRAFKIEEEEYDSFLPEGFEDRMEGKGLIIRDWAPQMLILDHQAVGGFMTHCGWNSLLEGMSAGVPMVTWPIFSEQFYNEFFITQVLKIGIQAGIEKWHNWTTQIKEVLVKKEKIVNVVNQLMGDGEEAKNMRTRAKELSVKAKEATDQGGSSYENLTSLIEMFKKPSTTGNNIPFQGPANF